MIENIFKEPPFPITLEDPLLIIGDKINVLDKVYVFTKISQVKVVKVGSDWIEDHIIDRTSIKGYFYCENFFGVFNEELEDSEIKIVGNVGNNQYQLNGVSVGKSRNSFMDGKSISANKFSALDYKIILLK